MKKKLNCVLLVDDDESENYIHKLVVEKTGVAHHIEVVLNGKEALDFIRSGMYFPGPELVFLDIDMPLVDGWEFLIEFRSISEGMPINPVIIVLTHSNNPADRVMVENLLGIGRYKVKPLTDKMMAEILLEHFPACL